jgi:hypothetical protein
VLVLWRLLRSAKCRRVLDGSVLLAVACILVNFAQGEDNNTHESKQDYDLTVSALSNLLRPNLPTATAVRRSVAV